MADQTQFGVTADGFVLKGIDRIVADQQSRAQAMFGADVDLTSGSALRKVLDAVAWDAQELWRGLEAQYYSNFVTTATGPSLDLLGTDLGITRQNLQAQGQVVLTLTNGAPGRSYALPEGTVIQTAAAPAVSFRATTPVTISSDQPVTTVGVQAVDRGPAGNLAAGQQLRIDPGWAKLHLNLGSATITPTNPQAFSGGDLTEADADFRSRLLGVPRTIWTVDALLAQVLATDGVRDAAIFDPLGGVDTSQSYFNMFLFGQRSFSLQRQIGSPYYFDIVVAAEPGWPWTTNGGTIPGIYDTLLGTVRSLRPASIFPNIVQANQVDIGIRATPRHPGRSRPGCDQGPDHRLAAHHGRQIVPRPQRALFRRHADRPRRARGDRCAKPSSAPQSTGVRRTQFRWRGIRPVGGTGHRRKRRAGSR